jgi:hypothetical protein
LVIVDAEFLDDDALEVDPPPAHDAVDLTVGPRLDDRGELSQLLRRQTRLRALRPMVEEAVRPRCVEAVDPVAQGLAVHAADPGRRAATHPVANRRQ